MACAVELHSSCCCCVCSDGVSNGSTACGVLFVVVAVEKRPGGAVLAHQQGPTAVRLFSCRARDHIQSGVKVCWSGYCYGSSLAWCWEVCWLAGASKIYRWIQDPSNQCLLQMDSGSGRSAQMVGCLLW
jgi:hypothetical protein